MRRMLQPAQRLIVAADLDPGLGDDASDVRSRVLRFADTLKDTGVVLKVNSALRGCGYGLIEEISSHGLQVFADLKLFDIEQTLATDAALLSVEPPDLLTVSCAAGAAALNRVKLLLPFTDVLGVTVLTSLTDKDTYSLYGCNTDEAVLRFARIASEAGLDGLICAPSEARKLRMTYGDQFTLNTPAVRPAWSVVAGDDQNPARVMTPAAAISAGADRIVVGRPITQARDPRDAVQRTIDEIASAVPSTQRICS